ncbi:MAG: IPT/TIG domain-containing protein, partial [Atopobiaceae bacterium]|nr:IPT/TIG domain-containing protein [Atopobiaceae bacterium]
KSDIGVVSLALNACEFEARSSIGILLDDGNYSDIIYTEAIDIVNDSGHGGWVFDRLYIRPDDLEQDYAYVTDSHGNRCLRLKVSATLVSKTLPDGADVDVDIYVDQIAIGAPDNNAILPYMYEAGTSMAAPVATASAAIVSSTLEDMSLADRAETTVRMLKGAIHQAEGYQGYCKQGGQIDLSLLGSEDDYVPTIASAHVSGDTLVIEGSYFSSDGTLLVAGEEAQVLSWSEGQIKAQWPTNLTSGLIPLTVRTDTGVEAVRAIPLEAPKSVEGSSALYERDLASLGLREGRESITRSPDSMCATDDGVLFVAARMGDDAVDPAVRCLLRSDDQCASWTRVELPQAIQNVHLAAGDGTLFVLGSTPSDLSKPVEEWHLYALDVANNAFTQLGTYGDGGPVVSDISALAYVHGQLYLVDFHSDDDDYYAQKHMRFRRFDDDYAGVGEGFMLDHWYDQSCTYAGPLVSTWGDSVYVCGIGQINEGEEEADGLVGLERLDVADDGSLTCQDLTDALSGVSGLLSKNVCIAASDEGVFLIGAGLEGLLPEGAAHTDTFLLKQGATQIEPYAHTLSFAPLELPVAVYADGWLYAYSASKYEDWPVFGRATQVSTKVDPEPTPTPAPTPDPDSGGTSKTSGTTNSTSSRTKLAKTGDALVGIAGSIGLLAIVGGASVVLGLKRRRA